MQAISYSTFWGEGGGGVGWVGVGWVLVITLVKIQRSLWFSCCNFAVICALLPLLDSTTEQIYFKLKDSLLRTAFHLEESY